MTIMKISRGLNRTYYSRKPTSNLFAAEFEGMLWSKPSVCFYIWNDSRYTNYQTAK